MLWREFLADPPAEQGAAQGDCKRQYSDRNGTHLSSPNIHAMIFGMAAHRQG
jgi:hypothetical protein